LGFTKNTSVILLTNLNNLKYINMINYYIYTYYVISYLNMLLSLNYIPMLFGHVNYLIILTCINNNIIIFGQFKASDDPFIACYSYYVWITVESIFPFKYLFSSNLKLYASTIWISNKNIFSKYTNYFNIFWKLFVRWK